MLHSDGGHRGTRDRGIISPLKRTSPTSGRLIAFYFISGTSQVGEELCIDYVPVKKEGNMRKTVECNCGSSDCRVRSARVFAFCH